MRERPRIVAGIVASFVLPSQLLAAWLQREALTSINLREFDVETGTFEGQEAVSGAGSFGAFWPTVLPYLVLPFIGVAMTHLVLGWRSGQERSTRDCVMFTLKKTHLILVAFVATKIVQVFTLLLLVPMTMLVAPVMAAEDLGPFAAIKRSVDLGRRRYGPLLGLTILILVVHLLLSNALSLLPLGATWLLAEWGWVGYFALNSIVTAILNVFGVGAAVLAYVDLRNRTEGADLARRLEALRTRSV